jgi:hypothetical protein
MIKEYLQRRKEKKAIQEWQNSTLGQTLAVHTDEYFNKNPRLSGFSEEGKNKVINDFYQQIFNFSQAENPFLAMREHLASSVIEYAGYQVLCLTEEEKTEMSYSDCPFISGELHRHIDKVLEHDDELGKYKWEYPDISNDELVSFCNSSSVLNSYYVNGFNLVRFEFDDIDEEKDWLNPFIKSMLIWKEDQIREKIALPSLLLDNFDALKHSTFMNLVTNGHKNPFYEWEKFSRRR